VHVVASRPCPLETEAANGHEWTNDTSFQRRIAKLWSKLPVLREHRLLNDGRDWRIPGSARVADFIAYNDQTKRLVIFEFKNHAPQPEAVAQLGCYIFLARKWMRRMKKAKVGLKEEFPGNGDIDEAASVDGILISPNANPLVHDTLAVLEAQYRPKWFLFITRPDPSDGQSIESDACVAPKRISVEEYTALDGGRARSG